MKKYLTRLIALAANRAVQQPSEPDALPASEAPSPEPEAELSAVERTDAVASGLLAAYYRLMDAANTPPHISDEDGVRKYVEFDHDDADETAFYEAVDRRAQVAELQLLHFLDGHRELEGLSKWEDFYEQLKNPDLQPDLRFAAERADQILRGKEVAGSDWAEWSAQRKDRDLLDALNEGMSEQGVPRGELLESAFYRGEYGLPPLPPRQIDPIFANEPPF